MDFAPVVEPGPLCLFAAGLRTNCPDSIIVATNAARSSINGSRMLATAMSSFELSTTQLSAVSLDAARCKAPSFPSTSQLIDPTEIETPRESALIKNRSL